MGYDYYSPEACRSLRPVLNGTWTANYATAPEYYRPVGSCCGGASNPCCGGANNPCCGGSGSNDSQGSDSGILLPERTICCCKPQVVLNSSTGGAGPLPLLATGLTEPLNVVSTTVNTCCVGNTNNQISFSAIINTPVALALTLNFQIVRSSCLGGATNIGPTFTFSQAVSIIGSESFSFQFVDNNVAPGTYTYSVQLGTGTITAAIGVTISNAVLTVLAVSTQNS